MTKIKFCGLSRFCDIEAVNEIKPAYVGFVFEPKSKRYVEPEQAADLKRMLALDIKAAGVFVNENPQTIACLLNQHIIDMVQLHGNEDEDYIKHLRQLVNKPIIKAFRIETAEDVAQAKASSADYILLDSGAGTGKTFNWKLIQDIERPYFLAGGLTPGNVREAIRTLCPFAVDVSSGVETDGGKDKTKMAAFFDEVRKDDRL